MKAIVRILEQTFKIPDYLREVRTTDKNWLEVSADEAIEKIISFLKKMIKEEIKFKPIIHNSSETFSFFIRLNSERDIPLLLRKGDA